MKLQVSGYCDVRSGGKTKVMRVPLFPIVGVVFDIDTDIQRYPGQ